MGFLNTNATTSIDEPNTSILPYSLGLIPKKLLVKTTAEPYECENPHFVQEP